MDDVVRSSKKLALKFSPLLLEKGESSCSYKTFCKNYRRDVRRFKEYNLNYEYINLSLGGIKPLLLMSWNIQFWTDTKGKNSFNKIVRLVKLQKPDILFLQEATFSKLIKFCAKTGLILQSHHKNISRSRDGKKAISYTTAILTKKTVNVNFSSFKTFVNNSPEDTRGYVSTQVFFGEGEEKRIINLVNVHLEPSDLTEETRLNQIKEIFNDKKLKNFPLIIAGDFNSVSRDDYSEAHWRWLMKNSYLDRDTTSSSYNSLPNKVTTFLKEKQLKDAGEKHETNSYTCWTGRRVDYIYHSEDVETNQYSVYFTDASDHFPILSLIRPKN